MTPLQKLTRLAQIERQLLAIDPMNGCEIRRRLEAEREFIMRGIGCPPAELANNRDSEAWALALAETFEGITREQAFPWFDAFGQALYNEGRESGTKEAIDHINAGTQGIIDLLRVIRESVLSGGMPNKSIGIGGRVDYLSEFITRTLKAAGLT